MSKKEIKEAVKEEKAAPKKQTDKEKIADLIHTCQSLQAEFENYKKRVEQEKEDFTKYAKAAIIEELLPILDSFEFALKNNTSNKENLCKGVEMIYAQLFSILEKEGLKPIKALGEKIDPFKHEVLMKEDSKKPEDTILEELQKGYTLNDKIIRHTKVKVAK